MVESKAAFGHQVLCLIHTELLNKIMYSLQKIFSVSRRINIVLYSAVMVFVCKRLIRGIKIEGNVTCGKGAYISCTDGGKITIGQNVSFGRNVKIIAQGGKITIGDNSFIGDGVVITAKQSISIGSDALIAEFVVIRDQDHSLENDPINQSGFVTSPIVIENNVWLAAKSSILKGVHIGTGAVVAAHGLVNKNVAARTIVAGVPAKEIGQR